jgi:hypothetical protein
MRNLNVAAENRNSHFPDLKNVNLCVSEEANFPIKQFFQREKMFGIQIGVLFSKNTAQSLDP